MTTKFDSKGQGRLTPALGTSWGHAPTFRLILDWDPSRSFRWATLIKSSSLPSGSAPYQVLPLYLCLFNYFCQLLIVHKGYKGWHSGCFF